MSARGSRAQLFFPPLPQEAEAGAPLWIQGQSCLHTCIPGQPELQSETLSQNQTKQKRKMIVSKN